jgi:hypothetical protein
MKLTHNAKSRQKFNNQKSNNLKNRNANLNQLNVNFSPSHKSTSTINKKMNKNQTTMLTMFHKSKLQPCKMKY